MRGFCLIGRGRKLLLSPTQHHSASTTAVIFFYPPFLPMRQDEVYFVLFSVSKEREVQTVFCGISTMILQCIKFQAQCFVLSTPVLLLACRGLHQLCLLTWSVSFFPFVWIPMWGLVGQFSFLPWGSDPYVFSKALIWTLLRLPFCGSPESGVAEIFTAFLRGKCYRLNTAVLYRLKTLSFNTQNSAAE